MDIGESQSDYARLGTALRAMIQEFDPLMPPSGLKRRFEQVVELVAKIGPPLEEEAQVLKKAFDLFRKKPKDPKLRESFLATALRLEQETREI